MNEAENKTNSFSKNVTKFMQTAGQGMEDIGKTIFTGAAVVAGAALAGVGIALKSFVDEAMEAQQVQAQLNQVLISTQGIAGVTADMANQLADQYSNLTMFEDDAVLSGENILLTFTNIGKDVFPSATQTMLDMSQALGQDLKSSAIQLGKALQDPVQGVNALQRVGVNFTDEQQNMIKAMVAAGDTMGAQKYILEELQREFGGSAEAAGKTFPGQLAILEHKINNVKETIGLKMLPALQSMMDTFISLSNRPEVQAFISTLTEKIAIGADLVARAFETIANGGLLSFFQTFEDGSNYVGNFLELLGMSQTDANAWGAKINEVATWIIGAFTTLTTAMENDKGIIFSVIAAIGSALAVAAWSIMAPLLPAIAVMLAIGAVVYLLYTVWTQNWGGIQEKMAAFWTWLQPILANLWSWLSVHIPIAIQALSDFWKNTLVPTAQSAFQFVRDVINDALQFISDLTSGKLGWMSQVWNNAWTGILTIVNTIVANIKLYIAAFQAAMSGDWYHFGELLRQIWDNTWKMIGTLLSLGWDNIKIIFSTAVASVIAFFRDTDWGSVGRNIVEGIANGITSAVDWIVRAAQNVGQAALDAIRGFLGIHSPSTVFEMQVGWQMAAGTALGWEKGLNQLFIPSFEALTPAPAMASAGMVGLSGGRTGSVQVVVQHQPLLSLGDRYEAEHVLKPMLQDLLRELGVETN